MTTCVLSFLSSEMIEVLLEVLRRRILILLIILAQVDRGRFQAVGIDNLCDFPFSWRLSLKLLCRLCDKFMGRTVIASRVKLSPVKLSVSW